MLYISFLVLTVSQLSYAHTDKHGETLMVPCLLQSPLKQYKSQMKGHQLSIIYI